VGVLTACGLLTSCQVTVEVERVEYIDRPVPVERVVEVEVEVPVPGKHIVKRVEEPYDVTREVVVQRVQELEVVVESVSQLPAGWGVVVDEAHPQGGFYYNKETDERSDERPDGEGGCPSCDTHGALGPDGRVRIPDDLAALTMAAAHQIRRAVKPPPASPPGIPPSSSTRASSSARGVRDVRDGPPRGNSSVDADEADAIFRAHDTDGRASWPRSAPADGAPAHMRAHTAEGGACAVAACSGDGAIDVGELYTALNALGLATSNAQARHVLHLFDADRSRTLDLSEFRSVVVELRRFQAAGADEVERL
jgi:hypothetical protein